MPWLICLLAFSAPLWSSEYRTVRGVTISCRGWGQAWGSDGFAHELQRLKALGANWVAIHPYASILADGSIETSYQDGVPPDYVLRPIREAHRLGMAIMIKPHLAYWGRFSWRGAIRFEEPEQKQRFFEHYTQWMKQLAAHTSAADAFVVGTELDNMLDYEQEWRRVIAEVRKETRAHLTFASNWNQFHKVPFWDALDAVGIQAYFPVATGENPEDNEIRRNWHNIIQQLRHIHQETGKPIVFTEFGYNRSLTTALEPWAYQQEHGQDAVIAEALQARCLKIGLEIIARESEWLRGCFLWKWFIGGSQRENFVLDTERIRAVIREAWAK